VRRTKGATAIRSQPARHRRLRTPERPPALLAPGDREPDADFVVVRETNRTETRDGVFGFGTWKSSS